MKTKSIAGIRRHIIGMALLASGVAYASCTYCYWFPTDGDIKTCAQYGDPCSRTISRDGYNRCQDTYDSLMCWTDPNGPISQKSIMGQRGTCLGSSGNLACGGWEDTIGYAQDVKDCATGDGCAY